MSAAQTPTSQKSIVLVEDDKDVSKSLALMLRTKGYEVDVYLNGQSYLKKHAIPADCLIIDYKMPGLDGVELLETLRAQGNETPALLMTGFYSDDLADKAQSAGFVETIEKPLSTDRIANLLGALGDLA